MLGSTWIRSGLALLVTAAVAVPLAGTQAAEPCSPVSSRGDGWDEIAPDFGEDQLETVVDFAAHPLIPKYILATNGTVVALTTNGGCTWKTVYQGELSVPANVPIGEGGPIAAVNAQILSVEVNQSADRPIFYVFVLINDKPTVAFSEDLGARWRSTTIGLPPEAGGGRLRATADSSKTYLLVRDSTVANALGDLYLTEDGGQTWGLASTALTPSKMADFEIDQGDPRHLWAWNDQGLFRSANNGATFTKVPGIAAGISTVATHHIPVSEPAIVMVYNKDNRTAMRSTDDGVTWKQVATPMRVVSAVSTFFAFFPDEMFAVSGEGLVSVSFPAVQPQPFDQSAQRENLDDLKMALQLKDNARNITELVQLFGMTPKAIFRRALDLKPPPRNVKLPPINLRGGVPPKIDRAAIVPENLKLTMAPGQSRTVPYRLDLPATPTPMDVFFETDSTGSMEPVIAGLREDFQDIINDLADSGIDVWFGIADFKDYDHPTGSPGDYPYKRLREVGPVDEELRDAIDAIDIGGGNGLDSGLEATYAAATGYGQLRVPQAGPSGGWHVEPNQGAEWRADTLRVIINAADVRSRDPQRDPGYPGPTYDKVIRALNTRNVKFVGLAVGDDPDYPDGPRETLEKVADGTNTVAPAGGTDCDDDKKIDLAPGDPLVCILRTSRSGSTSVAPAIVGLLRAVADYQPVELSFEGNANVVKHLTATVIDDVNLKAPNQLDFQLQYRCDPSQQGQTYPVVIKASSRNRLLAKTNASVTCLTPEPMRVVIPPAAAIALVPPAPAPPAPQLNSQPQPNPNPNPQANPNPNMAMAAEQQPQAELALAFNDATEDKTMVELAMSERTRQDTTPTAFLAAAFLMSAAAGTAMHRQRQRQRLNVARVNR